MKINQPYKTETNIKSRSRSSLFNLKKHELSDNIKSSTNKHVKLLSPSVKEWPNTVYNYNKKYIQPSFFKSQIIDQIMRSYFNLVFINKNNKNSKRMRDLIRRSSTKKLFISKPEIKHSIDKIIYTIYVFNKEKGAYNKKIFLLNKSLNRFNKYRMYNMKHLNSMENKVELNKIRFNNRLSTINDIYNKSNKQVISRSYIYKSKTNSFDLKNLFLHKTTRGLVHYINSYNIIKQKPLLELEAKKLEKKKVALKKSAKTIKLNCFVKKANKLTQNLGMGETRVNQKFKYKQFKSKAWVDLIKGKNNNYFSNKLFNLLALSIKKKQTKTFKSIFFFNFILWVLNGFNISVIINDNNLIVNKHNESSSIIKYNNKNYFKTIMNYDLTNLYYKKSIKNLELIKSKINNLEKSKLFFIPANKLNNFDNLNTRLTKLNKNINNLNNTRLNRFKRKLIILNKIKLNILNKIKLNNLNKVNSILFKLLYIILIKGTYNNVDNLFETNNINNNTTLAKNVKFLFKQFKTKYLWSALKNTLMKQLLGIHYLHKHSIDNFKYNKFLIAIKSALLKVYNKTPKINIVNLKYLHLNSDILLEAISIKLKNKKTNILRTIKKALKLVKLPQSVKKIDENVNLVPGYNKLNDESYDIINATLAKMFFNAKYLKASGKLIDSKKNSNDYISFSATNNLVKNIYKKRKNELENLRHKWITGVKIEGKGRLTKRYRADRSLFKIKYKGSLKNINFKDIYNKKHLSLKKTQSMMLLKGQTTPNIQYSFAKWKRHIGSYGVKGWISSN